ncbi:MAG: hypothetical protein QOE75_2454 [Solirubrobacterales bacterium]|jgi:hypothetical protein|nr:hypothetical protein [Solirubrobacterales bacterium]
MGLPGIAHGEEALCAPETEGEGPVTWIHEGEPLEEPACINLSGLLAVDIAYLTPIGLEGTAELELQLQPGGLVSVASFSWPGCEGTGFFAGLSCTAITTEAPSASVETGGTFSFGAVLGTAMTIPMYTNPTHTVLVALPTLSFSMAGAFEQFEAFSEISVQGTGTFKFSENAEYGYNATVDGLFEVSPAGTYGIAE